METLKVQKSTTDTHYFEFLCGIATARGAKILSFGVHKEADIRLKDCKLEVHESRAVVTYEGQNYVLSVPAIGQHWLINAAAAIAVAVKTNISAGDAIKALSNYTIPEGRGLAFDTVIKGHNCTIIDESYNANPTSMRAAISSAAVKSKGRLIAVLGDMFELGKDELELHASLAPDLVEAGVSRVITSGECMRALRGALPREMRALWVKDAQGAFNALRDEIESEDTVLIKGSNVSGLGELVRMIKSNNKANEMANTDGNVV